MRDRCPDARISSGAAKDTVGLVAYLAGQVGQATLDRLGDLAHPQLDQHVAAVREAAGEVLGSLACDPAELTSFLVSYASGFFSAATADGWRPQPDDEFLDWESMRLAAVCLLAGDPGGSQPG